MTTVKVQEYCISIGILHNSIFDPPPLNMSFLISVDNYNRCIDLRLHCRETTYFL